MRLLLLCFPLVFVSLASALPSELQQALQRFRAEGTRGWSFTQTTVEGEQRLVERFDAAQYDFKRWSLLEKDGRPPTEEEIRHYKDMLTRRTKGDTAPNVKDQIIPDSCEILSEDATSGRYRFQLKPGDEDDSSAENMQVTFTLHRPSGTIQRVELASKGPFSPVLMVRIEEALTVIDYSLPEGDRPTLLQQVTLKLRGRAMWVRSLNQDMVISYSDYHYPFPKPVPTPAP